MTVDEEHELITFVIANHTRHFGHPPTPREFLARAQCWEEIADSHGGDPVRYEEADVLWHEGYRLLAEAEGGEVARQVMTAYGWRKDDEIPERLP